jgi:hypothetical protein
MSQYLSAHILRSLLLSERSLYMARQRNRKYAANAGKIAGFDRTVIGFDAASANLESQAQAGTIGAFLREWP